MSQYYEITQYSEAGTPWSMPGRGEFQTFFLDIDGIEGTVTTNKKKGNTPKIGQTYGHIEDTGKLGKKGQKIYKFKQDQLPDGAPRPTASPVASKPTPAVERGSLAPEWFAPYAIMIQQLHAHLLNGTTPTVTVENVAEETKADEDTIPGTNLSKAELEDMFGGPLETIELEDKE